MNRVLYKIKMWSLVQMGNQYFECRFSAEWKYGHWFQTDTDILNLDLVLNENTDIGAKRIPAF